MTPEQIMRVCELRSRVIRATLAALKKDGHHKSSEAATEITMTLPNMFAEDRRPSWTVSIYSYVLGPSRNHDWHGQTLDEAIVQAEVAVNEWCFKFEMEEFAGVFGDPADDEGIPPLGEDPFAEDEDIPR
jgi:hypothetical protein